MPNIINKLLFFSYDELLHFVFSYDKNTHTFDLSMMESRSLRSEKAVRRELEPNTHISEGNRPYKSFRVAAANTSKLSMGTNGWPSGKIVLHDALTNDAINPCRTYKDDNESDDKIGSWRVPNLSELVLMMSYDKSRPSGDPALLPIDKNNIFVCNTVWGFTPSATVWGRAFTTKKGTNPWTTTLTDAIYDTKWRETQAKADVIIRCVKDVDDPTNPTE